MIALGRALTHRGHAVTLQTWTRWRDDVEREGMSFAAAPEYHVFPTRERPLTPYQAVVRATHDTLGLVEQAAPDAVVADILTLAPALAAELAGIPVATLVPHVDPRLPPGMPPYSAGARAPRGALGRTLWRAADPLLRHGLQLGRRELNETRARLGLPALAHVHGGISRALCLVATFPQLEPARARPAGTHVVGPLLWEPPSAATAPPAGDDPLVLIAPSTSQDPGATLVRAAVAGLAAQRLRVLATAAPPDLDAPANARCVAWLSYAATMPSCALVVCHGGHGTLARALASGCGLVIVPAGGDMNENAARVDRLGLGVRLPPRLAGPRAIALAVRRALADPAIRVRAERLRLWAAANDGAARAAELVERFAAARR